MDNSGQQERFLFGGIISMLSGYIGMMIAVKTNVRTTSAASESLGSGFVVAFRGGAVLGFCLVGLAILGLNSLILLYLTVYPV